MRSDGAIAWVKDKGQGIFDNEGKLLWLDGIILDIAERKQAEAALRASEDRFRGTFEQGERKKVWEGKSKLAY